ncbi:hypothetical protein BMF94_4999 [Rhodotorula taiwanensis]|uniref:ESCRT-II complex subunit VPS25 n=1 Tax=Rhodotorula taiwanensis TaxID=741276 RepID=A0A2S5B5D1_9BASI|nr:hypothetical protein BMF94_4999 [Rhodotorula taiwanensis]
MQSSAEQGVLAQSRLAAAAGSDKASAPSSLTLRPIAASNGFLFPSLYSFPPFFTHQPNPQTWAHQLAQWQQLVLAWARHNKCWQIDISEQTCNEPPFANPQIKRQLNLATLRLVIDALVANSSAEYDPKPAKGRPATSAWMYWKRPDEWATVIYDWIKGTGQTNSIMTFYELTEGGDLVHTTEFYRMPTPLLRKALDFLIKQGKAQVLKGVGEEGDGVKFV